MVGWWWFCTIETNSHKNTSNEVWTNPSPHITPQESHGLDQEKEENFLESNNVGDKLPHRISGEGAKMPLSNLSNSLSTFFAVRGGVKAIIAQFPTPSLKQPTGEQQPPFWMVNYWGTLTSFDLYEFSKDENYLLTVTHNVSKL